MNITLLEIGNDKCDTQHRVLSFDGTLQDYFDQTTQEIEANKELELFSANIIDDNTVVIDYFSFPMQKTIRHYAFISDEANTLLVQQSKETCEEFLNS